MFVYLLKYQNDKCHIFLIFDHSSYSIRRMELLEIFRPPIFALPFFRYPSHLRHRLLKRDFVARISSFFKFFLFFTIGSFFECFHNIHIFRGLHSQSINISIIKEKDAPDKTTVIPINFLIFNFFTKGERITCAKAYTR